MAHGKGGGGPGLGGWERGRAAGLPTPEAAGSDEARLASPIGGYDNLDPVTRCSDGARHG